MRHRITYIHSGSTAVESLNSTYVQARPGASREDRITLDAPKYSHIRSLRVQVIRPFNHTSQTAPFAYDYPVGLHIYVVPEPVREDNERENFYKQVQQVVKELLGITVDENSFILSLNSLYFHTLEVLAPRGDLAAHLPGAWDALDYVVLEQKAVIKSLQAVLDDLSVEAGETSDYTEIGIFTVDELTTRDDLVLSGARVVFNDPDTGALDSANSEAEQDSVQRTYFHVKPRHRQTDYVPVTGKPNGLHPVVTVEKAPKLPVDDDLRNCKLYYYLLLEKSVFFDQYQKPDVLKILAGYGTTDLELPEYSVQGWGNEYLLEVDDKAQFPLELTLHSRYQLPNNKSDHTNVTINKPLLFYGCEVGSDSFLLKNSPFDNKATVGGAFEKFFTEDTVFYQALASDTFNVSIPNAHGDASWVNLVTLLTVLLGVFLIVPKIRKRTPVDVQKKTQ